MKLDRRALLGSTALAMGSLSGCLGDLKRFAQDADILPSREGSASLSGMNPKPIVSGQPTIEDGVPAAWGTVIVDPAVARRSVDWGKLTPEEGDVGPGVEFRTFEAGEQCVTIIIGVLPIGYGLTGVRDAYFEDGTYHLEVEPYQAYSPESIGPEYHYDYTFDLWNLNGFDAPDEVVVDLHTQDSQET